MTYLIIVLICVGLIYFALNSEQISTKSHWHHTFEEFNFSPKEFYAMVEKAIEKRQIEIAFSRVTRSEGGFFSQSREYLRVNRDEYNFDICAAPYGSGFFVSWWLIEESADPALQKMPLLGRFFRKKEKTYFQQDTEIMFREAVSGGVQEAIGQMTSSKGIRGLTELEREPKATTEFTV